jgi:hypothetical protein
MKSRRSLVILCICCLFPIVSLAQTQIDSLRLAPSDEEFSATLPAGVMRRETADPNGHRLYTLVLDGTWLYIFSDPIAKANNVDRIQKHVEGVSREKISLGKLRADRFRSTDRFFGYEFVVARTKNRAYVFAAAYPLGESTIARKFLDSLGLAPKPLQPAADADASQNQKIDLVEPGDGAKLVANSPQGNGQSGFSLRDRPKTDPVWVLTKPQPGYTDAARVFEVEGNVELRVVLKSDKTVGAITVVKKLPFGLTEMAIQAASGMSFEPAQRDGIPYSVIKSVIYTFSIY